MRILARVRRILEAAWARVLSFGLPRALLAVLLLALVEGLLCFVAIPAWWHYDEPGHFEYVWLAAHSPTWPVVGQYDQNMRREMATSMIETGWYRIRNLKAHLQSTKPIPIGVTQVGDQPGYYFLASLPLRLIPNADITFQYYVARFVSLILYLLIVVAVWYAGRDLFPEDSPLPWMTTVFVALLPAFVDSMVSVNNDVAAVLAASLFFWAAIRLIQKGYSVGRAVFLLVSLAACYYSKSTAWFTFVLTPLVLVLALLRGKFAWAVWGLVALAMAALAVLAFQWGAPRSWYPTAISDHPVRAQTGESSLGAYAFQFDEGQPAGTNEVLQILTPEQVKALRNKDVTLGAWIWADRPTQAGPLFVSISRQSGDVFDSPAISAPVTAASAFFEVNFSVPSDAISATVYVQQKGGSPSHNNVFFDGLVLASGKFDSNPPQYADADGTRGNWDGQSFQNLLRNPSAEQGSFQIRKAVYDRLSGLLTKSGINPSLAIAGIQDLSGTDWYYRNSALTLFRTFWASLAGDKAFLASSYVNYFLALLSLGAVVGVALRLWRRRSEVRWDLMLFLGIALIGPWFFAVVKANTDLLGSDPLTPWARYAFPGIFPTALFLCAGWLELLEVLPGTAALGPEIRKALFFSLMAGITLFTMLNAIRVFHPEWWYGWVSLGLLFLFQYVIFLFARKRDASLRSEPHG